MWVRLDTNLPTHDKTLRLLQNKRHGWHAFGVYVMSLTWSGAHGTDGLVPAYALPALYGNEQVAALLVEVRLWEVAPLGGWIIRNWEKRQDTQARLEGRRKTAHISGLKGACKRYHEPGCECWKDLGHPNGKPMGHSSSTDRPTDIPSGY